MHPSAAAKTKLMRIALSRGAIIKLFGALSSANYSAAAHYESSRALQPAYRDEWKSPRALLKQ